MKREQFAFTSAYARAADRIEDPVERCAFYDAIQQFALAGELPDLNALPPIVAVAVELIMPQLVRTQKKAAAGRAGGANQKKDPPKEPVKREDPPQEPVKREDPPPAPQPPANPPKKEVRRTPAPDLSGLSPTLRGAVESWIRYKSEKNQAYKPEGLRALVSEIRHNAEKYGDQAVVDLINKCMSSNWQGIIFDRLAKSPPPKSRGLPDCNYAGASLEKYMTWGDV